MLTTVGCDEAAAWMGTSDDGRTPMPAAGALLIGRAQALSDLSTFAKPASLGGFTT